MRNGLLTGRYSKDMLKEKLVAREELKLFPVWEDRSRWESLPEEAKRICLEEAERYAGYAWPPLPAALFMAYKREGNRSRYQQPYFDRRIALAALAVAECVEGQGRWLDDVINGVWCICEETTWSLPAHHGMHPQGRVSAHPPHQPLPDPDEPVIDLFAAETGALLAFIHALLRTPLDQVSPVIAARIRRELKIRILDPYLQYMHWWTGLPEQPGRRLNNWTPWCVSNCLTAFLLVEEDEHRRREAVHQSMRSLDLFVGGYPEDGGCDEGPAYWNRAGGSLFDCLELLGAASGGGIQAYDAPLVQEIGKYMARVHIDGDFYVNYADGPARIALSAPRVYLYGRRIGDEALADLGLKAFHASPAEQLTGMYSLYHRLLGLFLYGEMAAQPARHMLLRDVWMKELEVMCAREKPDSAEGFFVSAKGGHNQESHNHNDVGSFVVYYGGKPVLIDVGVETYTAKTFSPDRYTIWTMQSAYHNLPMVNGFQQQAGDRYRSADAVCRQDDGRAQLELNIAGAYPAEAGILSWKRIFRLNREDEAFFELVEEVKLAAATDQIMLSFMTGDEPAIGGGGVFLGPNRSRMLQFDPGLFSAAIERIAIDDVKLTKDWGEAVYRIVLKLQRPIREAAWTVCLR